jgi:hypothetical protein
VYFFGFSIFSARNARAAFTLTRCLCAFVIDGDNCDLVAAARYQQRFSLAVIAAYFSWIMILKLELVKVSLDTKFIDS